MALGQVPVGVDPEAWSKVEAQLEAQGVRPAGAKADRDLPVEVAKLLPTPDLFGQQAFFGRAIGVDGDTMVVGANDEDQGWSAGAAFIFQRAEGGEEAWGQVANLTASDGAEYDNLGNSVSISGDTVVLGVPEDDDSGYDSGSAYVFARNQGGADAWSPGRPMFFTSDCPFLPTASKAATPLGGV